MQAIARDATFANAAQGDLLMIQGQAPVIDAPRFSIIEITHETAPAFLSVRRTGAKRNATAVSAYAQSMRNGEWVLNGMPIIISQNGTLLDGVQRLYACIEAKTSFVTVLAENIADDTLHTIDQQRRRSFTGVLETRGVPKAAAVASLLAKLIRYENSTLTKGTSAPPWSQMERALEANRVEIDTAIKFSFDHPARLLSESVRTPLSFMGLQTDRAAIRRLLDSIAHPDRFAADEPGVMIRRRLAESKADRARRPTATTLFAMCIKALNDTMAGAKSDSYLWNPGGRTG